jgi:hypothetical protein
MSGEPRTALIHPPVTDPTSPYHSLVYLDSYARAAGYPAADVIDANIEAFHYTYSPRGVAWLAEGLAHPADYGDHIDPAEVRAHLLRVGEPDPDGVRQAVDTLRDPGLFYRYERYSRAVDAVIAWMNCVGGIGFPGQFRSGFEARLPRRMEVGSIAALTDPAALAILSRPFQPYYEDVLLPRLVAGGYRIIGVNITYTWQLPFALWLIRLVRTAIPDAFLMAGGTEVSDVWKYARKRDMAFRVFADLDAIVVGEGESAYTTILDRVAAGRPPGGHPNVVAHPRYGERREISALRYEPLRELPTPDFTGLPWELYLSPERFVYYSPTRGCYWNKCTFCDYGLNTDGPTSPWRQDTVDTMIRDITALSRSVRFLYFSVDVLAPATILRFAERVVETGLDIRWGAEIRLERYWSTQRCELLRRSGCVAISVGFESGSQRILDLIDKGTKPEQVKQTMQAMTKAGIGVQVMGFTGFPTETRDEAQESIDFLTENADLWTFGGLGDFVLTSGAIVAKQPERFGVTGVEPPPDSDIAHVLRYTEPISQSARADVARAKRALPAGQYDRPWAGGIDTPHSYFYHDRFGTQAREVVLAGEPCPAASYVVNGGFVPRPDDDVLLAYHRLYGRRDHPVPPDRLLFRRADGNILALPSRMRHVLALFERPRTLADATDRMWTVDRATAHQLWRYLIARRLIRIRSTAGLPGEEQS